MERRYRVLKNIVGLWLVQRIAAGAGGWGPRRPGPVGRARRRPWRSLIDPGGPALPQSGLDDRGHPRAICAETGQPRPEGRAPWPGACSTAWRSGLPQACKGEIETLRGRPLDADAHRRRRLARTGCSTSSAPTPAVPVQAGPVETAALGNACVQLIALGVFRSLGEARELIRRSFPVESLPARGPAVPEAALAALPSAFLNHADPEGSTMSQVTSRANAYALAREAYADLGRRHRGGHGPAGPHPHLHELLAGRRRARVREPAGGR